MKNLDQRFGWFNRHYYHLPAQKCIIEILVVEDKIEKTFVCEWVPYQKPSHQNCRVKGYVGVARVILHDGITYQVWESIDADFVYYRFFYLDASGADENRSVWIDVKKEKPKCNIFSESDYVLCCTAYNIFFVGWYNYKLDSWFVGHYTCPTVALNTSDVPAFWMPLPSPPVRR